MGGALSGSWYKLFLIQQMFMAVVVLKKFWENVLNMNEIQKTEEMYTEISGLSRTPTPAATDRTEVLTGKWK